MSRGILSALLVAIALLPGAAGAGAAGPRIVSDAVVFDFGTVSELAAVEHAFLLRNIGDAPLVIQKVEVS